MSTSRPVTPASPKVMKLKTVPPGMPRFGCEHIQRLLQGSEDVKQSCLRNYKNSCRCVYDNRMISQTSKLSNDKPFVSLTPNYLCLQCPAVTATVKERNDHGRERQHRFYVESRNAQLFCQVCEDFIFDPTLEELRIRKSGTGSFSAARKRKFEEVFPEPVKEDPRFISTNTVEAPCRAVGIRGIYNMGATCYMNVILQSFLHNPMVRNFYLSEGHPKDACTKKNCMSCTMDEMFQDFYAQELTTGYSASSVLGSFWLSPRKSYKELATNQEQDAHEFFQFLCEELHEITSEEKLANLTDEPSAKRSKSELCDCIVHQTFYGKLQSIITCKNCHMISTMVDPILDLSIGLDRLAVKKGIKSKSEVLSLTNCLDLEYRTPEQCEYVCGSCGSGDATKQLVIKSLPNVLCIQLKRFKRNNGSSFKIETKVSFPLKLEMFPYTNRSRSADTKHNPELVRGCTYDLQSVVVHVGSFETGHYILYSRVGNEWFRFNDHNVTLASKSDVLNAEAFLLFYVIQSLA